ncbi:MAG: hypothetical protein PWR20_1036 [Bacteroidales bacterium]|jgi:hypothetical protein|nr:hypothetical protein [Bacteroidales bacterium]
MHLSGEVVRLRIDNRALSEDIVTLNDAEAQVGFVV